MGQSRTCACLAKCRLGAVGFLPPPRFSHVHVHTVACLPPGACRREAFLASLYEYDVPLALRLALRL